ncbi:MAG TPA: sulfite exporter TauE/SafE family protein, partial [Candidatus Saccharimonadales bacterium]|nr:sulfite exporter TauE/SafE family protein [Candidatus Saccharimonadales bacterium]
MKKNNHNYKLLIGVSIIFASVIIYLLIRISSLQAPIQITQLVTNTGSSNLWAIFLTGLITGGLTCLAVQGGLLASTLASQEEERLENKSKKSGSAVPISSFLISKLVAYTILGFLLGWFGSIFQLSLTAQIFMQIFVIVFMLGTAGNILEIHPIFRYFAIQPPKFLTKMIRNQSKSKSIFAPAILGAFTIFIPCGTTQAMMALAIGSGSPITGMLIMFAFILGTTPLFFILGFFATQLGEIYQKRFLKIAAIALIVLAVFNARNTLSLAGINISFGQNTSTEVKKITENPTIEFKSNGYTPNEINVKAGSNVTLNLKNTTGAGCIQSFVIPKLGLNKIVQLGET